jgi:hypothetical protein
MPKFIVEILATPAHPIKARSKKEAVVLFIQEVMKNIVVSKVIEKKGK